MPERLLDTTEVADWLNITTDQVRKLARTGLLPATNLSEGRLRPTYRFERKKVDAYLAARTTR